MGSWHTAVAIVKQIKLNVAVYKIHPARVK